MAIKVNQKKPVWVPAFLLLLGIAWLLQAQQILPTTLPLGPICAIATALALFSYSLE